MSNSASLVLIFGFIIFFVGLGVMTFYILRKNFLEKTVRLNFLSDGGHKKMIRVHRKNVNETIDYEEGKYVYDSKAEITTRRGKEIYYFIGNPQPLVFNSKDNSVTANINSENLKAIIETELIAKLFKKEVFSMDAILLIVAVGCSAIGLIMIFMIFQGGVVLKDNAKNVELMTSIIKQAIASGV